MSVAISPLESEVKANTKAALFINPNSRQGDSAKIDDYLNRLQGAGITVQRFESRGTNETCKHIINLTKDTDLVIVGGGDGSISAVVEQIYKSGKTLAVLPLGTANDFARSIGIYDIDDACNAIANNRRRRINLGKVNDHYFLNVAHIGLGVDVTHELTSEVKKRWGIFAYLAALTQALKRNKSFKVKIQTENWQHKMRSVHLAVGNGRFYGGGNIIHEDSTVFDGKLSFFSIKPLKWWQLLMLAPSLRFGTLQNTHTTVCNTATSLKVTTKRPLELEADGELITRTPATFAVIESAIEVIVGEEAYLAK